LNVRGIVVATQCQTPSELVERYYARCDDSSIFVGVVDEQLHGKECAFALLLANKQPAFAGICVVLEVYLDANNAYEKRGMRLGIRRLGMTSEQLFVEMAAARAASKRRFARGSTAPPDNEAIPELEEMIADEAIPIDIDDESGVSLTLR
jgi:hypothetical protein